MWATVGALNLRHKINTYFYERRNISKYALEKSFDVTHNWNYAFVGTGVKDLEKKVVMAGAGKVFRVCRRAAANPLDSFGRATQEKA